MILFLQLYRATTYNNKKIKKNFCCLHATSEAELFFSFNFTIFFGLVLKADWIFLFRAQLIRILLWTLKCYDIKITKKKKKERKYQLKLKKKKIKTKILTRHTFEFFTQRNDANSIQILWLKMKIYMSAPWD